MTPNQSRRARRGRVAALWGGRRRSRACMRLRFAGREPMTIGGRAAGKEVWCPRGARVHGVSCRVWMLLLAAAVASLAMLWCLARRTVVGRW
jgi:hypothetical protein